MKNLILYIKGIKWLIQQGIVVLVKSNKNNRIKENINVWDFELTQEEMNDINSLDENYLLFDHATLDGISLIKKICDEHKK